MSNRRRTKRSLLGRRTIARPRTEPPPLQDRSRRRRPQAFTGEHHRRRGRRRKPNPIAAATGKKGRKKMRGALCPWRNTGRNEGESAARGGGYRGEKEKGRRRERERGRRWELNNRGSLGAPKGQARGATCAGCTEPVRWWEETVSVSWMDEHCSVRSWYYIRCTCTRLRRRSVSVSRSCCYSSPLAYTFRFIFTLVLKEWICWEIPAPGCDT